MSYIKFTHKGNFNNTERFLKRMRKGEIFDILNQYGAIGVQALAAVTPKESGLTASQWGYSVEKKHGKYSIIWTNDHLINGTPLVVMLQYGHGTGTGGYVYGRDFINPAIQPIFDEMASTVWKEVTSS